MRRQHELRVGPRTRLAVAVAFVAEAVVEQLARPDTEHSAVAVIWIAVLGMPLFARRSHPVAATIAAAGLIATAPQTTGSFPPTLLEYVLPVILCYGCGAHAATRPGLAATCALIAGIQIHLGFADAPNAEIAIAALPPWWAGREVRRRRQLVRELAERTRELETEEEAFVKLSVERERARIARDLHDILSHHVALMVIQAGAGRVAEPWDVDAAATRLATIRDAGDQALTEADHLVSALDPAARDRARLSPLLDRARELGAHVVLTPSEITLPPRLEATAHHVLREAITNAMKHAPGTTLDIELSLNATTLTISVRNVVAATTSPIAATGSGIGLAGMRQRIAAAGGSFDAGEHGERFLVHASLPLGAAAGAEGAPSSLPHGTISTPPEH